MQLFSNTINESKSGEICFPLFSASSFPEPWQLSWQRRTAPPPSRCQQTPEKIVPGNFRHLHHISSDPGHMECKGPKQSKSHWNSDLNKQKKGVLVQVEEAPQLAPSYPAHCTGECTRLQSTVDRLARSLPSLLVADQYPTSFP